MDNAKSMRRTRIPHGALITLLASLAAIAPFSIDTYLPAFHDIQYTLDASSLATQQTLSAYLATLGIMALFHGALSDTFGRRRVVLISLAGMTLASLLCAAAPSIHWLIIGRALQGVFAGAGMVISRAIVRDLFNSHEAQKVMAQNTMVFSIAPAVAPVFGGFLLSMGLGWRSIFLFLAVYSTVIFVLVYRYLDESWPVGSREPWGFANLMHSYAQVFSSLRFWLWSIATTLMFIGMFGYVLAAPKFIIEQLGLTAADFGWMFIPTVAGLLLGSWWSTRLSLNRSPTYTAVLGLIICSLTGVANFALNWLHAPTFPWPILPLPFFTIGMGVAMPPLTTLLLGEFPTRRGTVSSCQASFQSTSNSLAAAFVIPLLWHKTLYLAMLQLVCGVMALLCLLVAISATARAVRKTP